MRRRIEPHPDKLWEAASKAFLVGNTLYLSGQIGLDADGNLVGDDMGSQARKALENIQEVLAAAGGTLQDLVHLTLYFKDGSDWSAYFEVAKEFFPSDPPPATGVIVAGLLQPALLIEINAIAVVNAA